MAVGELQTAKAVPSSARSHSMSPVSWTPTEGLDAREWVRAGKRLGAMTRCSQWWLGDWVRYGTAKWGEKYKEASRITGYDIQTLRNIAYVAGRIDPSRRRDKLTWSHHAEVSALEVEEQERWLDLAVAERMSVADLRIELRSVRREERRAAAEPDTSSPEVETVKCPACEHEFAASR